MGGTILAHPCQSSRRACLINSVVMQSIGKRRNESDPPNEARGIACRGSVMLHAHPLPRVVRDGHSLRGCLLPVHGGVGSVRLFRGPRVAAVFVAVPRTE